MAKKINQSKLQSLQEDKKVFSEYDISDEGMVNFSDPEINLDINKLSKLKYNRLPTIKAPEGSNLISQYKNTFIAIEAITGIAQRGVTSEVKISMILKLLQAEGLVDVDEKEEENLNNLSTNEKFSKMRELMKLQMESNRDIFPKVDSEMQFMDNFLFKNEDLNKGFSQTKDKELPENFGLSAIESNAKPAKAKTFSKEQIGEALERFTHKLQPHEINAFFADLENPPSVLTFGQEGSHEYYGR